MHDIPLSLAEVNVDWLNHALRESGTLTNEHIVGVDARVLGEGAGFMGNVAKLGLDLSAEAAPLSLVLKIPTDNDNRHLGQTIGVYEREIRFYQELQPLMNIRTPRHIYSAMDTNTDPERTIKALRFLDRFPIWMISACLPLLNWLSSRTTYRYVLLIENLENHRIGDQVGGCTLSEAEAVLDTMARMHARFWDSDELDNYPWLLPPGVGVKPMQMMYLQAVEQFKQAHAGWLTPNQVNVLDWLKVHFFDLVQQFNQVPSTLIHNDFRLDNLCFDDEKGEVILFDWQTLGRGPCGFDLAYFLSASFAEPLSRETLVSLLEYYRQGLGEYGVALSMPRLQWYYQAGLLGVLNRVVPAQFQDMLDLGEGRGVDLIDSWLERGFREVEFVDPSVILRPIPD